PAGRKADAAIAHHGGGDAVPGRRLQPLVPGRLAVVMGMDVDEAGRDEVPAGVDLLRAATLDLADSCDAAVPDGDVRLTGGRAGAIRQGAAADDEIVGL